MSKDQAPVQIRTSQPPPRAVVHLSGEIDLRSVPELQASLLGLARGPLERIVLDMSGVTYIDSSGVGTLVVLKREIERARARIVLAGLQPRVRSVFEITRLDRFFTIAESVDEAQAS
ncbi:MAG TPA: STAS domain-containing protein [Phycisphaerae bacterium]|nr:STAS domain-containing protein [Phycisphaerae bacterium]